MITQLFWLGMELNWEAIAGFVSALVSLLAFWLAFLAFRTSKLEAIQSVWPYLEFQLSDLQDIIDIQLVNLGVGPAIVKKVEVGKNGTNELKESVHLWIGNLPNGELLNNFAATIRQDMPIVIGSKPIPIIVFENADTTPQRIEARNYLRNQLKNLHVKVTYTDVYKNEFIVEKSLDWYRR